VRSHAQVSVFHTLIVWSQEPLISLSPCTTNEHTQLLWP
jgi:hypothetical protein